MPFHHRKTIEQLEQEKEREVQRMFKEHEKAESIKRKRQLEREIFELKHRKIIGVAKRFKRGLGVMGSKVKGMAQKTQLEAKKGGFIRFVEGLNQGLDKQFRVSDNIQIGKGFDLGIGNIGQPRRRKKKKQRRQTGFIDTSSFPRF